jgi:hypothetical protein
MAAETRRVLSQALPPVGLGMVQNQVVLGNRKQKGPIFKGCVNIFSPPLGVWGHSRDSFSSFVSPTSYVLLHLCLISYRRDGIGIHPRIPRDLRAIKTRGPRGGSTSSAVSFGCGFVALWSSALLICIIVSFWRDFAPRFFLPVSGPGVARHLRRLVFAVLRPLNHRCVISK